MPSHRTARRKRSVHTARRYGRASTFVSGQVGIDPATGQVGEGIEARTEQALRNVEAILEAAGASMSHVVKTTIWLTDASHFATVNEIHARHMPDPAPARSAPIVAALPRGLLISIEAIAETG